MQVSTSWFFIPSLVLLPKWLLDPMGFLCPVLLQPALFDYGIRFPNIEEMGRITRTMRIFRHQCSKRPLATDAVDGGRSRRYWWRNTNNTATRSCTISIGDKYMPKHRFIIERFSDQDDYTLDLDTTPRSVYTDDTNWPPPVRELWQPFIRSLFATEQVPGPDLRLIYYDHNDDEFVATVQEAIEADRKLSIT